MIIIPDDLKKYKVGTRILTKTFSSASKQRDIASTFHGKNAHTNDRLSTICIYQIRNERTALAIQHLSLFEYEEEVLILPYSAFNIIAVKQNKDCSPQVEIKLRECEPWVDDY
jgi:predicted transcriptional regulator